MPYTETFVVQAEDSKATAGEVPGLWRGKKTQHMIQYELLTEKPYGYSHDDLLWAVHVQHKGFSAETLKAEGDAMRHKFFSKEHPCMRASGLTKKLGWGAHYDADGKIALYAVDSAEYANLVAKGEAGDVTILKAMRSARKK